MKKIVFTRALASFAAVVLLIVFTACATGLSQSDQTKFDAAKLVYQGSLYEERFNDFIGNPRFNEPGISWVSVATASSSSSRRNVGSSNPNLYSYTEPPSIPQAVPSEKDIDSAIECYEKALKLNPSGTLSFNSFTPVTLQNNLWMAYALENNAKELLDNAKRTKQSFAEQKAALAAEQSRQQQAQQQAQQAQQEQQARQAELARQQAQQAEIARQQAERARQGVVGTGTNSPNDFEIANSSLGGIKITKYKGTRTNVVIPDTIDGLRVTELDYRSFASNVSSVTITSVVLPSSLIEIGSSAFNGQPLTSISLPNSLRRINSDAFIDNKFTSVVIPNGVTFVGAGAFGGGSGGTLTSVVIPPSLANYQRSGGLSNSNTDLGFNSSGLLRDSITRITLPANVDPRNFLDFWGYIDASPNGLRDAYVGNSRKAGIYVWTGRIWRVE
jgi:hypothetical protein